MVYKNFRIVITFRIILLAVTLFLAFYFFYLSYYAIPVFIAFLMLLQLFTLFRYIDKTNRELAGFIQSIRFSEFNRSFRLTEMGKSYTELNMAFNDVIKDFQSVRSEKEEQFHYLQGIVQNIDVSIIAYLHNGQVEMMNQAVKKLFQINTLNNINDLLPLSNELVTTLINLEPGINYLVKVQDEEDILQLAIYGIEFKTKDKIIIVATIKDIQNVLESQETEAWQKLIRVLTHEIMNSITPISSISSTLETTLKYIIDEGENRFSETCTIENAKEIKEALKTINKRSNGLMHFVETYRNLTRIPKPDFTFFEIKDLFNSISKLFKEELTAKNIQLIIKSEPENLELSADLQLIEQILINLLHNSVQALHYVENATIELKAFFNKRGHKTIQVIDNGQGIIPEVLEKIFIPFFTTKPQGSGIGLSLSRQIMKLHGGTITAKSEPLIETVFTLTF